MQNTKLILVDGSAFLFRAYFSTLSQNLTNDEGFPTGAIFGVINSIKKLERLFKDAYIIVIFDAKGDNFRHKLYPEYKSHRRPMDKDLAVQIEPLYKIIRAMGYAFLCIDDVEADDVIATLATSAKKQKVKTIIASSDKDLFQLIDENIKLLDFKDNIIDSDFVYKKLSIKINQVLDYLSLTGDTADNIPGVPKVGPKTASNWLNKYGSVDNIKKNANKITGKIGENLRASFELIDLSKKLVTLKTDVKLPFDIAEKKVIAETQSLAKLYKKYGFLNWYRQLSITDTETNTKTDKETIITKDLALIDSYEKITVLNNSTFEKLIADINTFKEFAFDTETTSLNVIDAKLVGLVFGFKKKAYYLPVGHNYLGVQKQLDIDMVLARLKPIFTATNYKKIGQNIKYDAHILANYQIELNGIKDDTMLKSYCINSVNSRHNLDDLALIHLNHKNIEYKELVGSGRAQICFSEVAIEKAAPYAIEDVIVTNELNKIFEKKISSTKKINDLYKNIELPLIKVIMDMERNGVKLDLNLLTKHQHTIENKIKDVEDKIYEITNMEFNISSPKQVAEVLYDKDKLAIPIGNNKRKSTNENILKELANEHKIARYILEYRSLTKLVSTYIKALPQQINPTTNRLHTSYHQAVTATGRLSSSNPNLQNIPIRTDEGRKIRQAFIADKNKTIIAADYSQIELRIMAHLSQDAGLLNAFKEGLDIHLATASQMFNKDINEVSENDRRNAKAINFGLIYGMGSFGLAKQINSSRTIAKEYIDTYFKKYPKILQYIENTKKLAQEQGYVETIIGRRLYLPDINSKNRLRQSHALRTAINAPMQGSSADIIKKAMLDIHSWIKYNSLDIKMTLQVHDELVFEVDADKAKDYAIKISDLMANAIKISIPLVVDIGIADNWQKAH